MLKKIGSTSRRTHVLKRDSGWAVKKEGAKRATKVFDTKANAIKRAMQDKAEGRDVVIHRKDGSVESVQEYRKN